MSGGKTLSKRKTKMRVKELITKLLKCGLNSEVYLDGVTIQPALSVLREPRQVIISCSKNTKAKEKV